MEDAKIEEGYDHSNYVKAIKEQLLAQLPPKDSQIPPKDSQIPPNDTVKPNYKNPFYNSTTPPGEPVLLDTGLEEDISGGTTPEDKPNVSSVKVKAENLFESHTSRPVFMPQKPTNPTETGITVTAENLF
tara:strand:- start:44 stop:433 length:390 start_codon:yes stop_codon:yes gene_type:complete